MPSPLNAEITPKAITSSKWVFLASIVSWGVQPIVVIILARLLTPTDFGLIVYCTIFMSFVAFQDFGLNQALIQKKYDHDEAADVVFFFNVVLGIFWFITTLALAPSIAIFFKNPQITNILKVISLTFLISPFGSVQNTLLKKELYFKKLFYFELVQIFAPGVTSILLALNGFGVWSLVSGVLAGTFLRVLALWLKVPWRPRWRFNLKLAAEMLRFGFAVSAERILSWVVNTIDDMFVGKYLGGSALGMYRLGFNISIFPAKYITSPLINVAYPSFSKLRNNREDLKRTFLKALEYTSLITFPMGVGLITTAPLFIPVLFGERWLQVIPVIEIISVYGIFMSIGAFIPQVYKAIGRPDIYLKYVAVRSVVAIPIYYLVVPFGLKAVSFAHLSLTMLFFPVNFFIGMRVMNITLNQVYRSLWVSVFGSFWVGFVSFFLLKYFSVIVGLSSVYTLGLVVVLTGIFYLMFVYFISRDTFNGAVNLLFAKMVPD